MQSGVNLDIERECRNCIYRKTGWICTHAKSKYSQQRISSEHTCSFFEPSRAEAHFIRAFSANMFMLQAKEISKKEEYAQEVTKNYSDAIAIGLPAEDEVSAKMGIATACAHIVSRRMQSTDNMSLLQSPEIYKMILNLQEAGALQRKHGVHELAKTWFQLAYVDLLLDLKAAVIGRDE